MQTLTITGFVFLCWTPPKYQVGLCLPLSDIPGKLPEWISPPAFWSLKILPYQRKLQTGPSILNHFSPIHCFDSDKHLDLGQNPLYFRSSVMHLLHTSFIQLKRLMPLLFSFFFSFFFYHNYSKCLKNTRWGFINNMFLLICGYVCGCKCDVCLCVSVVCVYVYVQVLYVCVCAYPHAVHSGEPE